MDTYLFWDDLHPTSYAHGILANYAYDMIEEATSPWLTARNLQLLDSGVFTPERADAIHAELASPGARQP